MANTSFKKRRWFIPLVLIGLVVASFIIIFLYQSATPRILVSPTTITNEYPEQKPECANSNVKTWAKVFAWLGFDYEMSLQQTSDNGYVVAGHRNSGPSDSGGEKPYDVLLFKVDADGNKIWEKTFGGSESDFAWVVKQTYDGGFIIGGETRSFEDVGGDAYLVKTDANGNVQWEKSLGICGNKIKDRDNIRSVQQTSDRGYIAAGWTRSCSVAEEYNFLLKTDANGNKMWEKDFIFWRGTEIDIPGLNSVIQTSDGGYVALGFVHHRIPDKVSGQDIYLMKTDANGNMLWNRTYERVEWDMPKDAQNYSEWSEADTVQQTTDGGYIIVGTTTGFGGGGIVLLKTDADGNKIWGKVIGEINSGKEGYSVKQTADGGYFIIGTALIRNYEERTIIVEDNIILDTAKVVYLLKTDANGNTLSETLGGHRYGGRIWSIQQTPDGGYISAETIFTRVSATKYADTTDILMMKLNENGVKCNLTYGKPCTLVPEPRWINDPTCKNLIYDEDYKQEPYFPE